MTAIKTFCIFSLLFPASLNAQPFSAEKIKIYRAQDERDAGNPVLAAGILSPKEDIRVRALIALGNIQDSASVSKIAPLLLDQSSEVRRTAAWALGQIGGRNSAGILLDQMNGENDSVCRVAAYEAIGKCGTLDDLRKIKGVVRQNAADLPGYAAALTRFALRGLRDSAATEALFTNSDPDESVIYALLRINQKNALRGHAEYLLKAMRAASPVMRMRAVSLLGIEGSDKSFEEAEKAFRADPDWRVRVNALRAIRNSTGERFMKIFSEAVNDANDHLSIAALALLGDEKSAEADSLCVAILNSPQRYSFRGRGEAARTIGRRLKSEAVPLLAGSMKSDPRVERYCIEGVGETGSLGVLNILLNKMHSPDLRTALVAVDGARKISAKVDRRDQELFFDALFGIKKYRNSSVAAAIAGVMKDTSFRREIRQKASRRWLVRCEEMKSSQQGEAMAEFLSLYGSMKDSLALPWITKCMKDPDPAVAEAAREASRGLTGKEITAAPVRIRKKKVVTERELLKLSQYAGAIIHTSEGEIRIRFTPEAAPLTVLNFITLAEKKYFSGTNFHRVVSNFVIQGGDPDGTGFGGPGYAIRTEVDPGYRFTEGAVGMASSGKDTEGSQFFITHCPTPHLDGRYSVFGYTEAKRPVDLIQEGSRITSVQLLKKK